VAIKAWGSKDWKQRLSKSTTVYRADTDVGAGKKPWFIFLSQTGKTPAVRVKPRGRKDLLLTAREARALVQYLLDSSLLELDVSAGKVLIGKDA
jgi:hypothetical protein